MWHKTFFVLTLFLVVGNFVEARSAAQKPNIVVVITDDQGYGDVGIHGNKKIKTPNIDRFAREGIQLTRFYVSPVCAPTRAALMTGRYYYRTGVLHTNRGAASMHGDETTIAEVLSQTGYRTGLFGKWHLGDNYPMRPQDQGFREVLMHKSGGIEQPPDLPNSYFDPLLWRNGKQVQAKGYCADVFFDAAFDFIEKNRQRPFFVYLPMNTPHTPLQVSDDYAAPYRAMGLDDTTAKIYGMVQNIDDNFGRLLTRLDELKLRDNTLVIFMTDNGPQQDRYNGGLRGRKTGTYEGGIRVPFFIQWPAQWKGGRTIEHVAADMDLFPTFLELAGTKKTGARLDGVSLLPLLSEKIKSEKWPERELFFQVHRGMTPQRYQNSAVVTQRYKLVGYPGTFNQADFKTSETAPVLELYDLKTDPAETNNLAATQPKKLNKLRAKYDAWFDEMKRERDFDPGVAHLGTKYENPAYLCVWQDAVWSGEQPQGWMAQIDQSGRFEIAVDRGEFKEPGELKVTWQGKTFSQPVTANENKAIFKLPSGKGLIDIRLELDGIGRISLKGNNTTGDVTMRRL